MSVVLLDANGIKRAIARMSHEILEANQGADELVCLGVLNRGWPVAKRLAFALTQIEGTTIPCGKIDVTSSRDDEKADQSDETDIPFSIVGKNVVLVDEVIFTGRTIRAALEAIMKHGRPKSIQLACLIDRGHRELPIQPEYVGRSIETERDDYIFVKVGEIDGDDRVEVRKAGESNE